MRNRSPLREATLGLLQQLVPVRVAARNDGLVVVLRKNLQQLLKHVGRQGGSFSLQEMKGYLMQTLPQNE